MTRTDRAVDEIHEAVQEAIRAGMSAEEFKRAAAVSWREILQKDADRAVNQLVGKG